MSKYIDRDMAEQALIKEAALILRKMPYITIADSLDRMIKIVQEVPAADVAPVVHGRWENHGSKWQCANCKVLMSIDGTPQENSIYYCPNCGAKMDKEEK